MAYTRVGGRSEFLASALRKLMTEIRQDPTRVSRESLPLRAYVHGLRLSSKKDHRQLLLEVRRQPWLSVDLSRIVDRSLASLGS